MKIHKLNSQGTLAVVIPKDIAEMLNWKEGHDVVVSTTDQDYMLKLINKTIKTK